MPGSIYLVLVCVFFGRVTWPNKASSSLVVVCLRAINWCSRLRILLGTPGEKKTLKRYSFFFFLCIDGVRTVFVSFWCCPLGKYRIIQDYFFQINFSVFNFGQHMIFFKYNFLFCLYRLQSLTSLGVCNRYSFVC